MSVKDPSVLLLPACPLLANLALPLEPWTAPIPVMSAAAASVKRSSLAWTDSGKGDHFVLKMAVAVKVSSRDTD